MGPKGTLRPRNNEANLSEPGMAMPGQRREATMRMGSLLAAAFALAMFAAIPASTPTHAMSLVGGITKTDDGLIVLSKLCKTYANKHQRHLCYQHKRVLGK
jgi:hypothetical protein